MWTALAKYPEDFPLFAEVLKFATAHFFPLTLELKSVELLRTSERQAFGTSCSRLFHGR